MRLEAFLEGLAVHSRSFTASCLDLVEVPSVEDFSADLVNYLLGGYPSQIVAVAGGSPC